MYKLRNMFSAISFSADLVVPLVAEGLKWWQVTHRRPGLSWGTGTPGDNICLPKCPPSCHGQVEHKLNMRCENKFRFTSTVRTSFSHFSVNNKILTADQLQYKKMWSYTAVGSQDFEFICSSVQQHRTLLCRLTLWLQKPTVQHGWI
jgi:hypothetical protein